MLLSVPEGPHAPCNIQKHCLRRKLTAASLKRFIVMNYQLALPRSLYVLYLVKYPALALDRMRLGLNSCNESSFSNSNNDTSSHAEAATVGGA